MNLITLTKAEIAKGVAQLQLMGMTLEDTKKISSGLLDFETSISNQISAELLTGKQFNLERARLLALNRDYVGVGKEIVKQGMTSNYLNGLNEIQLEDQAKLFNLNSDELTDIVRKQETYNALSVRALQTGRQIYNVEHKGLAEIYQDLKKQGSTEEQIKTILGDKLYLEKQSEDAQTKFNKALEQAKGAFERLVSSGALDKLVEGITKFVNLLGGGQASSNKAYELEQQQKISQQSGDKARVQELSKLITEQKQEAEDASKTKGAIEGGAKGLAAAIGLLVLGTALDLTGIGAVGGVPMQVAGLTAISASAGGLTQVGLAVMGIGAGLGLMAIAGFAALPAITALIGLAAVAPALVALGGALGGLFGGGGEKEDKMDELIGEIRELKSIMSQGGVVNMDGKKVGDVLRLAISTSGVR